MDAKAWYNPDAIGAVHKVAPRLPNLQDALVAFFNGALATWERFTAEFEEGSSVYDLSPSEKDLALHPPTNDVNEGALGSLCSQHHKKPNMTILHFNALKKFKFDQTAAFVKQQLLPEDYIFVHKMACSMDAKHLERKCKAELIAFKDKQIATRKEKVQERAEKQAEKNALLASIE